MSERPIVSYEDIKNNPMYEIISEQYVYDAELKEYALQSFEVRLTPLNNKKK